MIQAAVIRILLNDELLLLKRRNNDRNKTGWCLPGGKIELDETPEQCILRETEEETGLKLDHVNYIGSYNSDIKNDPCVIHVFEKKITETVNIKISNEHSDYMFTKFNKLTEFNLAGKTETAIYIQTFTS